MQTAMLMTPDPVMSRRSASTAGLVLAGRPAEPSARDDPFWTFMVTAGALSDTDLTWEEQRDQLREAFSALLGQFGVAAFSYHIVQCPTLSAVTNPPASIVSTMPARWSEAYEDEFLGADPILAKATATRMPFTWRELEAAAPATDTDRRFFRQARHCGLIDCLTIPVHVERGIAALTMAPRPGEAGQMHANERLLFLAAYHFHQRIRRPVVEVTLAVSPRRRSLLSPARPRYWSGPRAAAPATRSHVTWQSPPRASSSTSKEPRESSRSPTAPTQSPKPSCSASSPQTGANDTPRSAGDRHLLPSRGTAIRANVPWWWMSGLPPACCQAAVTWLMTSM